MIERELESHSVAWYASSGDIARCGPFKTQIEAYQAFRLTKKAREHQRQVIGTNSPYPADIVIWPEILKSREKTMKLEESEASLKELEDILKKMSESLPKNINNQTEKYFMKFEKPAEIYNKFRMKISNVLDFLFNIIALKISDDLLKNDDFE